MGELRAFEKRLQLAKAALLTRTLAPVASALEHLGTTPC